MIAPHGLRKAFGLLVAVMASGIVAPETSPALGPAAAILTLTAVGTYMILRRLGAIPRVPARITGLKRFRRLDDVVDRDPCGVATADP